jgi:cation diffusion facilitator family transporter
MKRFQNKFRRTRLPPPVPGVPSDYRSKERYVFLAFLVGVVNFSLKLASTIIGNSATQFTDLLRNAGDTFACLLTWLTVRRIRAGKLLRYDYGFGKLENAASLLVAGMMFITLIVSLYTAFDRFHHPVVVHRVEFGFFVAVYAVAISAFIWRRTYMRTKLDGSPVLESQWHLFRAKTMANFCVVLSLGLSMQLKNHPWALYIDPIASLILAGFLVYSIYSIASVNVSDLLDRALDESLQLVIMRELAAYFEDYVAFHGLRSRRAAKHIYIDIFLEFDGSRSMGEVQKVIDSMRRSLEQKIPGSHVVIAPTTSRVR